ncbi:uncharacterized protein MONOS_4235 [Monocercomonoides exilis]|uniref:uncharacterized protein n=1 Tax=Monocercomonoides exilis TaxID=2049356 RepID=UPI00355A1681|nr:hypothetical protein MONOS_4235 [Monocercomonoides exilis]|eukprot:MONOS_4235.1-p1 / transcript=MONOS_4235.1 / gene=MONOS_4235 / organism=Monocercomonoides_exilis_PA203 / gene_product=unspecified product / transcript_product=unspecified product / location=Mono_scaffold00110:43493-44233(+) / protein_length=186 / sequence_SO=supercontig / SO=protein_coding / is_pseudo=false
MQRSQAEPAQKTQQSQAALDRSTQTRLRTAAANGQTEDRAGDTVLWSMQQVGKKEGAALLLSLGKALSHFLNQFKLPQTLKPITIPSSHAGATGGILANDANKFLNLLCGMRLFSLGGEDAVRDAQLVENMKKEMNVWRGEEEKLRKEGTRQETQLSCSAKREKHLEMCLMCRIRSIERMTMDSL